MCQSFILASNLETIEKRFAVVASVRTDWTSGTLVRPGDHTLIITQQNPKTLTLSKFGMTPSWAKQPLNLIHARAEGNKNLQNDPAFTGSKSIFLKPAFKRPLVSQRCIVVADAFIEWSAATGHPYLIFIRNHERPFGLAGVYDIWVHPDTKAEHHGFAVITIPGNALLHRLPAARMPVIIPKGREIRWLRNSSHLTDILGMLEIFPAEKMNAYPLNRDYDKTLPVTGYNLKPAGDRIYTETEQKIIPHRHWGPKLKGGGQKP
jgi:putative SOS response-associated peptidase YedK